MGGMLLGLMAPMARGQSASPDADRLEAVTRFWRAEGPEARLAQAPALLARMPDFDALHEALARGPRFETDVPRGRMQRVRTGSDGQQYPWMLLVPEDYDPSKPHFLRMELHGGMGAPEWPHDGSWAEGWRPLREQILVLPAGWWDSMWWTAGQTENLAAILAEVKRDYNVDENRVVLVGSSDGHIGSMFHAFRNPTAYAAFGGSIGCPVRLTNPTLRIDGQMHLPNLRGSRFFMMNGGRDRLFPVEDIRDYWDLFREHADEVAYLEYPKEGHGFNLTDDDERTWGRFIFGARRDPLPDTLTWATERTDRYARRAWLEITALDKDATVPPDHAIMPRICTGKYRRLKPPPPNPYGQVELQRTGNHIEATTLNVARFRLLLSPDKIDFEAPVVVSVNGQVIHDETLAPDPAVMLRRAAHDLDRRMLFGAELELDVP